VTHLGQRLSALIDGELDGSERERVLLHMTRCDSCRDEVAALRMLKRRMSAFGEGGSSAGAGLTGRLIGLSALASLQEREDSEPQEPPGPWPDHPVGGSPGRGPANPEQRAGRYFLAGSLAIFLAGLGTAAVIAGGESQPQAPTLPVRPSVDVMVFSQTGSGAASNRPGVRPASLRSRPGPVSAHPAR
jgi:anti-sigma factor RsiW